MGIGSINSNFNKMFKLSTQLNGFKVKGVKSNVSNPLDAFKNEKLIAENLAKAKDKNGEWINSEGLEGMDITNKSDWRKVISVSDEVKNELLNVVKDDFIKSNGGIPENSSRVDVKKKYISSLPADKRASAAWTLDQICIEEGRRLTNLVKQSNSSWRPGQTFDKNLLEKGTTSNNGIDVKI